MRNFVLAMVVVALSGACTKNSKTSETAKINYLDYKSAIKYQFKDLADPEQAAMVDGAPVSWSQLLSNDVALQELQNTYYKKGLAFAYSWGASYVEQNGPATLTLHMPEPEMGVEAQLKAEGLSLQDGLTVQFQKPQHQNTLASLGDKTLTWSDYNTSNIQHSRLYSRLFQQRMQRLNGIVVRRFLLQASKQAQTGMEEFVRTKIIPNPMQPTVDDVKAFARERGIAETDLDEKMIERLQEIVKQNDRDGKIEDYVAKNLISKPIDVAFPGPKKRVQTPEITDNMPQWGDKKGPELVFVGHWDCEDCSAPLMSVLQTKDSFQKVMQGAFIYSFPDRDREARMGAEAALCVKKQSPESFWTFVEKILEVDSSNPEEKINLAAQGSGINYDEFRDCFLRREEQKVVEAHLAYAKNLGITSAPLVILQGDVLELPVDAKTIADRVQDLGVTVEQKSQGLLAKIKSLLGF